MAVIVLRLCLEFLFVHFYGVLCIFLFSLVNFPVSKLSKPLSSSREADRL